MTFLIIYLAWQMLRLPTNRPGKFQKSTTKKAIVLAGDSITHGRFGENYVTLLTQRLDAEQYDLVNAGVNSQLAWNLLQRLDEIIACEPDYVTIMIGTNDAFAVTSQKQAEFFVKRMKLPKMPDQLWFRQNLQEIVTRLQEKTSAKIALISIPPIGEDKSHFAFKTSSDYCESIKEIASVTGVTYLPFHEKIVESLDKISGTPTYPLERVTTKMITACFKQYILRNDWNSIGAASGFQLHIDYLHLNTKGALMVSELIEEFIRSAS
ncbi:MAG: SGNH/GDSL hydrolase family protein [Candidatus Thorarchaeota archaeon]